MDIPKLAISVELGEAFDRRAIELVKQFTINKDPSTPHDRQVDFDPGVYISSTLGEADIIGEIRMSLVDEAGHPVARYFGDKGAGVILEKEAYTAFERLADTLMDAAPFRALLSRETVENHLFDWLKSAYRGTVDASASAYVIETCQRLIRPYEVWVPVAQLSVQSEFEVGMVKLRSMSPGLFDAWQSSANAKRASATRSVDFEAQRKKFQGRAAAVIRVIAELERAKDIAHREVALALSLLRVFSPASLIPTANSYCLVRGSENLQRATYFVVDDGIPREIDALEDGSCRMWPLDNETIALCRGSGLDTLTSIVRSRKRTEFQDTLINAAILFSRVSIQHDISDKVVYLLASMEALFSKSGGEPIQDNLATRLALVVGKDLRSRQEIVSTIKKVYSERSKYLHSGGRAEKAEVVKRAMWHSWHGLIYAIERHSAYERKEDLLSEIDRMRLSGGL